MDEIRRGGIGKPLAGLRRLARGAVLILARQADVLVGPYSRLGLVADSGFWVIANEMRELGGICDALGVRRLPAWYAPYAQRQSLFFGSHFDLLLSPHWFETANRFGTAFFHGRPGKGNPEFDECFRVLKRHRERVERIQVSHLAMRDVVLEAGVAPERVFVIPIGVNLQLFPLQTPERRSAARRKLKIPDSAVVIGSFQKDGQGWGEGYAPKLIKGPDIFLDTVRKVAPHVEGVHVLLSGPARGYVKRGLVEIGVPFTHALLENYHEVGELYQALDVYLVASREEGGPKAVLEAMSSGVPLVTTRVGQAMDLVRHGENGWMVEVEDSDGLAEGVITALGEAGPWPREIREAGRRTAEENSYDSQVPNWEALMEGFVSWNKQ